MTPGLIPNRMKRYAEFKTGPTGIIEVSAIPSHTGEVAVLELHPRTWQGWLAIVVWMVVYAAAWFGAGYFRGGA